MTDPGTYTRPWAAGLATGEVCWTGETRALAIDRALEHVAEDLDWGELDPDAVEASGLEVYQDTVWCEDVDGCEDCACGMSHEGGDRMISWTRRERIGLRVTRPASEDDVFEIETEDTP